MARWCSQKWLLDVQHMSEGKTEIICPLRCLHNESQNIAFKNHICAYNLPIWTTLIQDRRVERRRTEEMQIKQLRVQCAYAERLDPENGPRVKQHQARSDPCVPCCWIDMGNFRRCKAQICGGDQGSPRLLCIGPMP